MKGKEIIKNEQIEDKIIELRGVRVILDADVAALYEVETKEVNKAVKNNPKKFPNGYVLLLMTKKKRRSKILTTLLKANFLMLIPRLLPKRDYICWLPY